ncbi:Signal peptide peptidase-like 3 [Dissostichus eleginoides]|uniref:Signal peptide peptidase-like 3 n=1 Tax=Dissostichus eleginoides TaxID=100907 RepID=A0AAD9FKX9_DISEL|nr:Signal peptide peptidase-like 3 [Dissostichus eleginoides]
MGLKLQAILLMAPSNPSIDMSRDLVIRCLMVCLGESTDHLLKEYDDPEEDNVSQDLAAVRMTIYRAKNNAPEDIDIVVEGIKFNCRMFGKDEKVFCLRLFVFVLETCDLLNCDRLDGLDLGDGDRLLLSPPTYLGGFAALSSLSKVPENET